MGKYSSDSDCSSYKSKSRRRNRSSGSSPDSVKRSSYSSKHSSSSSRRDRFSKKSYRHKSERSRSRNSRHSRSYSREASRRRSRSYEKYKSKSYKSKASSRRSSSKSSSSKSKSPVRKTAIKPSKAADALREKLLKSIQAADSADKLLKQQGALPKNYKSRNDLASFVPLKPSVEILNEIENDSFQQRTFVSVKNIEIPEITLDNDENSSAKSALHSNIFDDQEAKLNRWVKKLFQIRQKALRGDEVEQYKDNISIVNK